MKRKSSVEIVSEALFELTVNDEQWKRVDSFDHASPNDSVYRLDSKTGEISFGDGVHGRSPSADGGVISASYKYGGGAEGQVDDELTLTMTWTAKSLGKHEVIGVKIAPKPDGMVFRARRVVEIPYKNKWAALLCRNIKKLAPRLKCRS